MTSRCRGPRLQSGPKPMMTGERAGGPLLQWMLKELKSRVKLHTCDNDDWHENNLSCYFRVLQCQPTWSTKQHIYDTCTL